MTPLPISPLRRAAVERRPSSTGARRAGRRTRGERTAAGTTRATVALLAFLAALASVLVGSTSVGSTQEAPLCGGETPTIIATPGRPTVGTDGDDVILGTPGPDQIDAGDGDDIVCGRAGRDQIDGGTGDDVISGGPGHDRIVGGAGDDDIAGEGGGDLIWGEDGADRVIGGGGRDEVWSGSGDDIVRGGGGRDVVRGGLGHDVISGGSGDDALSGSEGNDRVLGGVGDDVLSGVEGDDDLRGGPGFDECAGGVGADRIRGCEEPNPPGFRPTVVAIGDSVMRGAGKSFCGELERAMPGLVEDTVIGRQFGAALPIVERFMADTDREIVFIVALGTNGPFSAEQVDELLAVDERARFVFVNVSVPRTWEAEVNTILARAVAANRDRAALADWHAVASADPTLTVPDETHLTCRGATAYAEVVAAGLITWL